MQAAQRATAVKAVANDTHAVRKFGDITEGCVFPVANAFGGIHIDNFTKDVGFAATREGQTGKDRANLMGSHVFGSVDAESSHTSIEQGLQVVA